MLIFVRGKTETEDFRFTVCHAGLQRGYGAPKAFGQATAIFATRGSALKCCGYTEVLTVSELDRVMSVYGGVIRKRNTAIGYLSET